MDYKLIDIAYGGLLHDIGKFYQRTYAVSNLTEEELDTTPINKAGGYHDHLHSGYTSRFIKKYLNMYNEFEKMTSEHHKQDLDKFISIIRKADHIASAIDRQDELFDNETGHKRKTYITERLYSVLSEVDFNKDKEEKVFPLSSLLEMNTPISNFKAKNVEESSKEYKKLFERFSKEVENNLFLKNRIDYISYNYMYNLMNKYLVTIPASTYGGVKSTVSLYDHLKITSAIASCLYTKECFDNNRFIMLELDVSGIQKFIYQVVEGESTKQGLAKALRGRSALVGLITNAIAYAFLNEFDLTVSNILFNTGGGAMLLLPYASDTLSKVDTVSKKVRKELFRLFQTDITFVSATIELDADELERFQSEKAIKLKNSLGRNKMKKFSDIADEEFFYERIENNNECEMCGRPSNNKMCSVCKNVEKISDIYTKNDSFGILYDFNRDINIENLGNIDLGFVRLIFVDDSKEISCIDNKIFVDAINEFDFGNRKLISNLVPLNKYKDILTFEQIVNLTPDEYGDKKLAILKMDVDNLGGIFAFGLKNHDELRKQRSISKYVTMSRLMEFFFGHEVKKICLDVSEDIRADIEKETFNKSMFYINYAGGDDLVIIGSAYSITKLALEIHKRFSEFTGNKNITISGGIHFQNDKRPVRFGVQEAETQLEMSKSGDKNAITLMNTTVPFHAFESLLNTVYEMCQFIEETKLSRTMLYNIMSFVRDSSYNEYVYLVPRIQYTLFRNIEKKNQDILQYMKKELSVIKNDEDVRKFVLKLKLVMLFTRDN